MFTKFEALHYKCLRYTSQSLNSFNLLIGPNATGKSTFLDILGFLSDLMNKSDIIDTVTERSSNIKDLLWLKKGNSFELAIEANIPDKNLKNLTEKKFKQCRYEISIGTEGDSLKPIINKERFLLKQADDNPADNNEVKQNKLFPDDVSPPKTIMSNISTSYNKTIVNKTERGHDNFYVENKELKKYDSVFTLGNEKSALKNLPDDEKTYPISTWFKNFLKNRIKIIMLDPGKMKKASPPSDTGCILNSDGSNLPRIVRNLSENHKQRYEDWIEHLKTALPNLEAVDTRIREDDMHCYLVLKYKNGMKARSKILSDGTLRLLALTIIPYLNYPDKSVFLIEEPENGIHPGALEDVYKSLSSCYNIQVLAATHSPMFLNQTKPGSVLCFAMDKNGATDIVRGDRHPKLKKWKEGVSLGDLFAGGVLG